MPDQEKSRYKMDRTISRARVTITLVGDHLNELPDPVVLAYAGQALLAAAQEQGVELEDDDA